MKYIVSITLFVIITKILFRKIKIFYCMKEVKYMPYVCANLGYVINLSGKKGSGKTTTASGIVHYLIVYIQLSIQKRMDNIRKNLPKIDFNKLENEYLENFEKCEFQPKIALKKTIETYSSPLIFSDFLSIQKEDEMLETYLRFFYILNFRKRYVLSKTSFFDCINLESASLLDPSSLELNNLEQTQNYQVDIGMIFFNDENSNGSGNVNSNNKEVKRSGRKEFRSLIRNAYEELSFEVSTKQVDIDEVAGERRQIDANLNIRKRKIIHEHFFFISLLKGAYRILIFPKKIIWLFAPEKEDEFKKKTGFLRNLENLIVRCENLIGSAGYIKVYCRNYFEAEDVGKKDRDLWDKVVFTFPKRYCYASVDTYEWKALATYYETLNRNAIHTTTSVFDEHQKVDVWLKSMKRGD